jgi:hypothetical protein
MEATVRRRVPVLLLAMAMLVGMLATSAAPAEAVTCYRGDTVSYSSDWSRTVDINGYCGTVGARHKYDPVWSGINYWTGWYYDADAAQSSSAAELYIHDHCNTGNC